MATTYTLIGKQTVGAAGTTSVVFSNIPQTYTDLLVKMSARTNDAGNYNDVDMDFNGESSRQWRGLYAVTTSAASSTSTGFNIIGPANGAGSTASTFSNSETYIPNYTSTGVKSLSSDGVAENNSSSNWNTSFAANTITNSAAVTSITITPFSGNSFQQYSTFYLYGISNSSTQNTTVPYASGGDVITTDGTYWYHAFKYSGTFTPLKALSCDVLVVAGGGGGGRGGAGAGGLAAFTGQGLSTTDYTVTIGGGGAGRTSDSGGLATQGSNSQFGALTAAVGGGAGAGYSVNGGSGGSGGGAGWGGGAYNGGSATSGQGYAGGNGNDSPAAGGGGAGAAGANGGNASGGGSNGNGGVGSSTYSSWGLATSTGQNVSGTYYFAGGGGGAGGNGPAGGSGGNGGGGAGGGTGYGASNGTANTGGGGGGGWNTSLYGGTGGSGIVIVRYAV